MCVICDRSVDDGRATPADGVAFECSKHGAYAIARNALSRFILMATPAQEAALENARLFAPDRNSAIIITALDLGD